MPDRSERPRLPGGEALAVLHSRLPGLAKIVNGWQSDLDTVGVYGDFYVKRMQRVS